MTDSSNSSDKKKQRVLIIENDNTRVEWLKDFIRPDANNIEITHDCVVLDFVSHFENRDDWDLVIFDCDLDPGLHNPKDFEKNYVYDDMLGFFVAGPNGSFHDLALLDRDKDGFNGEDAARFLCDVVNAKKDSEIKSKILTNTKMLVWSANPDGAKNINKTLTKTGFKSITEIAYRMHKLPALLGAIRMLLKINN